MSVDMLFLDEQVSSTNRSSLPKSGNSPLSIYLIIAIEVEKRSDIKFGSKCLNVELKS